MVRVLLGLEKIGSFFLFLLFSSAQGGWRPSSDLELEESLEINLRELARGGVS